jgi:hypothetical protein
MPLAWLGNVIIVLRSLSPGSFIKTYVQEFSSGCPETDVMILKIFSPKISAKKLAFLTQNKAKLCKSLIITLVFEKNANFFRQKLSKIAENCDHNIDPRLG